MYYVRSFQPTAEEYAAIVAVHRAAVPDARHTTVDAWRTNDQEVPPGTLFQRIVAQDEGSIIAEGTCYEAFWEHHSDTMYIDWNVHPAHADAALDTLLYERLMELARAHAASTPTFATTTREDRPARIAFLERHDFTLAMRSPRSALAVPVAPAPDLRAITQQHAEQGIEILTLEAFQVRAPAWRHALYALRCAIVMDVPSVEPQVPPTMQEFEQQVLDDPALDPRAWFVAVDATRAGAGDVRPLVGMSNLWVNDPARKRLDVGLTGVLRAYRRRGIARALKLHTIAFAHAVGAHTIETANEEHSAMYQLNVQLGFAPLPALLSYRRR